MNTPNQKLVSKCCGAEIICQSYKDENNPKYHQVCSKCHQPCELVREDSKSFISITGLEVNNPNICIRGKSTFACICPACIKRNKSRFEEICKLLEDTPAEPREELPLPSPSFQQIKVTITPAEQKAEIPPDTIVTSSDTNREVPHPIGKWEKVRNEYSGSGGPADQSNGGSVSMGFMQLGRMVECGHCRPELYAGSFPCECGCHKKEDSFNEFIRNTIAPPVKPEVRQRLFALKAQWEARAEKKGYERGKGEVNQFLDKMVMNLDEVRKEAVRKWSAEKRKEIEAIIAESKEPEWYFERPSALRCYMTLTLKKILALLWEKEGDKQSGV